MPTVVEKLVLSRFPFSSACWLLVASLSLHGVAMSSRGATSERHRNLFELHVRQVPYQRDPDDSPRLDWPVLLGSILHSKNDNTLTYILTFAGKYL